MEATAYARRLLLRLPVALAWLPPVEFDEIASIWCREFDSLSQWELFVGWRKTGGWSVYFDVQPVLQFNSQNQLRRIYGGGQRYVAEGGRLKLLGRDGLGGQVRFEEKRLESQAEQRVLQTCHLFLAATADLLRQGNYTFLGQYPPLHQEHKQDLVPEAIMLLASVASDLRVACTPQAG